MIRSMTGFGRAEVSIRKKRVRIELNSVNNRYREISIRLPKMFADYESQIREAIGAEIARGKVSAAVSVDDSITTPEALQLNEELARTYYKMFSDLKRKLKLSGELQIGHFAGFPDLFSVPVTEQATAADVAKLLTGVKSAVKALGRMRRREGKVLAADMLKRVDRIGRSVEKVKKNQPRALKQYRERLSKRINDLTGNQTNHAHINDETKLRLDMEVTIMADKSDVTEECVRLRSHVQAFARALKTKGDVGKRLGFILQEMNREANTIGSKVILYDMSAEVIGIKEEIEKIREQVQNIE